MTWEVSHDGGITFEPYSGDGKTYDEVLADLADGDIVKQAKPSVTKYHKRTLYDLFYNDFLYDNSKGKIRIRLVDSE